MAAWCVDAIVQDQDLMVARRQIKKNRDNGRNMTEKLAIIKKMEVVEVFLSGLTRLGKGILENTRHNFDTQKVKET